MADIKIVFLGDITGRQGRSAVKSYIDSIKNTKSTTQYFIIANVENASHGFGLTKKNYDDLSKYIDCMTSGNHIWDKKDIYEYIDEAKNIVRPINYPTETKGKGLQIFEIKGEKIAVINVLGRVFMPPIDSPWQIVVDNLKTLQDSGIKHVFIDFHAEATAEKLCFAKYLAQEFNTEKNALIKGFFGTHTHVQTADEQIYNGMAYITDAGFCGATDGVIGMEFSTSLKRLSTSLPERYEVALSKTSQINGVEVLINQTMATSIKRINLIVDNNEFQKEAAIDTGS